MMKMTIRVADDSLFDGDDDDDDDEDYQHLLQLMMMRNRMILKMRVLLPVVPSRDVAHCSADGDDPEVEALQ